VASSLILDLHCGRHVIKPTGGSAVWRLHSGPDHH